MFCWRVIIEMMHLWDSFCGQGLIGGHDSVGFEDLGFEFYVSGNCRFPHDENVFPTFKKWRTKSSTWLGPNY